MNRSTSLLCAVALSTAGTLTITAAGAAPAPPAAALLAGDLDGDGSAGVADCAPTNPAVHPGAADRPDLAFTDTNCDGIDGDRAGAVFVSLAGSDGATGTAANPLRTINAALAAAETAGKDVYVAGGTYAESLGLRDDVGVYGSYVPGTWARSVDEPTTVQGAPGALADGDVGVVLQHLRLAGQLDGGGNSYGLRAINTSRVVLEGVRSTSAAGAAGSAGSTGGTGTAATGLLGGAGGAGACGSTGIPGNGFLGAGLGLPGATGAPGPNMALSVPAAATWTRPQATGGGFGTPGGGGQGGRGGFGATDFFGLTGCGGAGGQGGRGGGPGNPGQGGVAGGGSFPVYAFNSSVVGVASQLVAGNGGAGGNGGNGGNGGIGGLGGFGLSGTCSPFGSCGTIGLTGLPGAVGGAGGPGGGAVGGPSAAVYQGGASSGWAALDGTTTTPGTGGLGGFQGNAGSRAPTGQSIAVLRASGAPTTSTADFDGDGKADPADACPADPGGSADADGDGCAEAPQTSITSGPAENGFLLSNGTSIGFGSSEGGSTFQCATNGGDAAACTTPRALSRLSARTHVFEVWATDSAGTADPTSAARVFTVPRNNTALTHSAGWSKRTGTGYFLNTYSTTTRQGAALTSSGSGVRRIALVATRAPGHGKVGVYLGRTLLKSVSLAATRTRKKQLISIATFPAAKSGTIKVKVLSSGKPVRIEGLGVATR